MAVKDENYFQVGGWMVNQLGLSGNALMVYAIIFGFSQDGESEFTGSRQYLCDFTGASKPTIDKALNDLVEMGLIIKTSEQKNGITFNTYKVDFSNFTGGKETLLGGKETLPNNIDINNNTNNKNINSFKKKIEKEKNSDDSTLVYEYYLKKAIDLGYAKNMVSPTKTTIVYIKLYLKEYSLEIMKQTIDRYFEVISDRDYFFDTYWQPEKFFKQKNAFKEFLDDGLKWVNYQSFKKSKPKQKYNNPNQVQPKELSEFEKNWFKEQDEKFWGKK